MTLTIEERERRAYIEGNLELADALGGEIDDHAESLAEVEHEIESLRAEVKTLQDQLDEIEDAE